jgi:uncharacterized membrane protein
MTEANTALENSRESHLRSLLKAITYRITGTITTGVLVYVVSGELRLAMAVGALEPLVKIVVYYLHERIWSAVPRGAVRRLLPGNRVQ